MFDRYKDVAETVERQLLDRSEPPSHAHAKEQLRTAGIKCERVVSVYPDAILFVNEFSRAMTAWSEIRPAGAVVFYCEAGFAAWPSAYLGDAA